MIKIISFLFQMALLKKSYSRSPSPLDYIEKTGEKARGYFLFSIGCLVGAIFLLIALVVAIIGMGLQIEQHGNVSFTGLMISATIFLVISIFVFIVSSILLVIQKQKMLERMRAKEREQGNGTHVTPLLEEILKQILFNLASKRKSPESDRSNEN